MQKAVVIGGKVINTIEIEKEAIPSYCALVGCELFNTFPWGLTKGDTYDGTNFYRDGELLPIEIPIDPNAPDPAEMEAALNELGVETREND